MNGLRKNTILLVEDSAVIAATEIMFLEQFGYSVISADSGEKAVEIVKQTPGFDLILMDINLGEGLDGTATAEIILKDHDVPIVFLSRYIDKEEAKKMEKIFAYGCITGDPGGAILDASIKMALKLFEANQKIRSLNSALELTIEALKKNQ